MKGFLRTYYIAIDVWPVYMDAVGIGSECLCRISFMGIVDRTSPTRAGCGRKSWAFDLWEGVEVPNAAHIHYIGDR
jgi:hypothetical protein